MTIELCQYCNEEILPDDIDFQTVGRDEEGNIPDAPNDLVHSDCSPFEDFSCDGCSEYYLIRFMTVLLDYKEDEVYICPPCMKDAQKVAGILLID